MSKHKTKKKNKQVKKQVNINTVYSNEEGGNPISKLDHDRHKRGIQVYSTSQIINSTGRDWQGQLVSWGTEVPYFYLSITQRIQMAKLSSPVFGVISSRMNRISAIDFNVTPIKNDEDRIVEELKGSKQIYQEREGSVEIGDLMIRAKAHSEIKKYLFDVKPDLSNFGNALIRWKRRIKNAQSEKGEEIKEWMEQPNTSLTWSDFIKKWVFDLLVHGAVSTYKSNENGKLQNFDLLPGGSTYRLKNPYFSAFSGYIQYVPGYESQIYFDNELSYTQYLPTSSHNWGMIPLEALVNKISESLLFDKLMAEQADGTKPPEKMIIVTQKNPFGDFDKEEDIPLDGNEQKRIEEKANQPVKNAIMTFSGNDAKVVDLSRENTMGTQNSRQKDIREEVALVFNMSNMEVNLTGSDDTSGRSTGETQEEIEQGKGITPILRQIENKMTRDIITARYGYGYKMEFNKQKNEKEEALLESIKLNNGEITVNEIRESKNSPRFSGEEHDQPRGGQPGLLGEENNPLITREIK